MPQRKPAKEAAPDARQRLNSWKEIAAYLDVAVRTAQRWEAAEDLPVRRHRHAKLSSAYAYADEIDRWWDSRPEAGRRKRHGSRREPSPPVEASTAVSIVVLPFANLDRDRETEILSDGLTEDLITALSQIKPLRVVARSSAFHFKGKNQDVREIGASLGVRNVLEGSLRRAGDRLRVTAQLVSASDGCHLWARRFDRLMEDPFDLQEQLAHAIAAGLRVELLGEGSALRTRHIETYNAFLQGRFFWNQRTPQGLRRALRCFEQAVEREPDFALGHAGIAECHVFFWAHARVPWRDAVPKAQAAVARARQIDPSLGAIWTSLGSVRIASFDISGAGEAFRRALESNPGDHRARHWHAMTLANLGRCEEAIPEIERALELDPLGVTVNQDIGRILFLARRYDEAIARLRHTLEIAPKTYWARVYLALAYVQTGGYQEALAGAKAEPALVALVKGKMGEVRAVHQALAADRKAPRSFTWRALLHLALGERQQAIESLQRARERFEFELLELCPRNQPLFEDLRSNPEFEALAPG